MTMAISVDALLGLIEGCLNPFRLNEEDDTELYFAEENDFLNLLDNINEQIENLTAFENMYDGQMITDKTKQVAQLALFIATEEGISSLTKTFSIFY